MENKVIFIILTIILVITLVFNIVLLSQRVSKTVMYGIEYGIVFDYDFNVNTHDDDYFHPTIFCTRSTIKPENYKKKVYTKI